MSKKKGADPEITRKNIISAATEEFYEHGYEKASLRQICARAGVTTGAIYCFFKNKEDLLSNVMEPIFQVVNSISTEYNRILEDDFASFENFRVFFSANRKLYRILHTNLNNPVIAEYLDKLDDEFSRQIVKLAGMYVSGKTYLPQDLDAYTIKCLSHSMVSIIVKIIAEESDDRLATAHLVTTMRVFKNGILSLLG